jgi:starch phosphorylase
VAGASGGHVYTAAVSAARPAADYTARVIPHCDGVAVPLEAAHILWQR